MKKIKSGSAEFENFKEGGKEIKNTGTKIDVMVKIL